MHIIAAEITVIVVIFDISLGSLKTASIIVCMDNVKRRQQHDNVHMCH